MSSRLSHRSTDRLPEPAQQVLREGIEARLPAREIVEKLAALGFTVPERTVCRRAVEWLGEQTRHQVVEEFSRLGLSSYTPEQVFAVLDRVDVTPGWYARGASQISKAIRAYVADANPKGLREIVVLLTAFGLSQKLQQVTLSRLEKERSAPEFPSAAAKGSKVA